MEMLSKGKTPTSHGIGFLESRDSLIASVSVAIVLTLLLISTVAAVLYWYVVNLPSEGDVRFMDGQDIQQLHPSSACHSIDGSSAAGKGQLCSSKGGARCDKSETLLPHEVLELDPSWESSRRKSI
jgi:hypothetical protein